MGPTSFRTQLILSPRYLTLRLIICLTNSTVHVAPTQYNLCTSSLRTSHVYHRYVGEVFVACTKTLGVQEIGMCLYTARTTIMCRQTKENQ
jgi:hypothetical protein